MATVLIHFQCAPPRYVNDPASPANCLANLQRIGQGIELYAKTHKGALPDTLGTLLITGDIDNPEVLICPESILSPTTLPTTRQRAADIDAGIHVSYVYLGKGLPASCDPATIIVYEPLTNHRGKGMSVLFGDGHVEFVRATEATKILSLIASGVRPVTRPAN
jgi:prepilin-type processing-associated H-X9-DG protein